MKFGSKQFLLVNLKPINKNIHKNKKEGKNETYKCLKKCTTNRIFKSGNFGVNFNIYFVGKL